MCWGNEFHITKQIKSTFWCYCFASYTFNNKYAFVTKFAFTSYFHSPNTIFVILNCRWCDEEKVGKLLRLCWKEQILLQTCFLYLQFKKTTAYIYSVWNPRWCDDEKVGKFLRYADGGNTTVNMFITQFNKHVHSSLSSFQHNSKGLPTFSSSHHLAFHTLWLQMWQKLCWNYECRVTKAYLLLERSVHCHKNLCYFDIRSLLYYMKFIAPFNTFCVATTKPFAVIHM